MNIIVNLKLNNAPDGADLEVVADVIRRQLNEWLDFDQNPNDLEITCSESKT
jgi:hypothetical protein